MYPDSAGKIKIKIGPDTLLPAKSNSDVMFCLQSHQGLVIDKSHTNDISIRASSSGVSK